MSTAITTGITNAITWAGQVVSAIVTDAGPLNGLMELLAIGLGLSLLMFGVKVLKGFCWGA